jgi:hypothetical protein
MPGRDEKARSERRDHEGTVASADAAALLDDGTVTGGGTLPGSSWF